MADYDQIMKALRNADAAGDTAAATRLAQMAREAKRAQQASSSRNPDGTYGEIPPGMVYDPNTGGYTDLTSPISPYVKDGAARAVMQGLGQGVSFGGMDEVVAAGRGLLGPGSFSENYDFAKAVMDEELRRARTDHPMAAYGAEIGGALAVPVGASGGASRLARVLKPAVVGAGQGGIYAGLSADGGLAERAGAATIGAGIGAALGVAAPMVGAGVKRVADRVMERRALTGALRAAPSLDDLRAHANALYQRADQVAPISRAELATRAPNAIADAVGSGMDDVLTPGAARVASQIQDAAQAPSPTITFRELDILRKRAGIPAGNTANRTEQMIAMGLIDSLDDVVAKSDPSLGAIASEARATWARMSRAQRVADAMQAGDNYVSGSGSGMRNQIASLLRNPKRSAGYSAIEKAELRRVSNPGVLENIVHLAGGGLGQIASGLTGAALGGSGGGVGAAIGAAVGAGAGAGARKLSEAITRKKASDAMRLIAVGGANEVPELSPLARALIERLYVRGSAPVASAIAQSLK